MLSMALHQFGASVFAQKKIPFSTNFIDFWNTFRTLGILAIKMTGERVLHSGRALPARQPTSGIASQTFATTHRLGRSACPRRRLIDHLVLVEKADRFGVALSRVKRVTARG